jgi:phosphoribosyl 1,2-cyclic phosphodiesterase
VSLSDLAGILVSSDHGDHAKAVKDLLKAGIDCYMSTGTAEALNVKEHHRTYLLMAGVITGIREWKILPFRTAHDAAESMGFVIGHEDERLLFVAETEFLENRFSGISIFAIECNFDEKLLHENISKGYLPPVVGHRVRRSHFSLENVISFLKANDLSRCRSIFLLHLSDGNSDERHMKQKIQEELGVPVYVAKT